MSKLTQAKITLFGKKIPVIVIAIVLILMSCCCIGVLAVATSEDQPTTETTKPVDTEKPEPTNTLKPTEEPKETNTPAPTNTTGPTNTPQPTDTPAPTNTPRPTDTPIPPTPTPEPIILSGTGDSLVDIEKSVGPGLVHITGNAGGRHFAVKNYDSADQDIDLLVNTTDPYDGIRPLDFMENEHTFGFAVSATGEWTIEVMPLAMIELVTSSGKIDGNGDYVFAIEGDAKRAKITGNADGRHFAIFGYGTSGKDMLINTTESYDGEIRLSSGTFIIEVIAHGEWSISLEE